ncbi:MAG: lytic polysaccharide monooxygenase [Deltaproteobacteria bacterium]|nr:lytic polysaccharide monooxygenase [Deltaproteobacteria bacterium]
MRRVALLFLLPVSGIAFPIGARAHLGLLDPPSRYGPDVLKTAPCGVRGGARSTHVVTLPAGSTLEIRWDEYINHPGHYRVAFDPDGDDDFRDPVCIAHCDSGTDPEPPEFEIGTDPTVLLDMIPDMRGGEYVVSVTLPDIACDNCTLQVIQVMYDKRPYTIGGNDNYYQCIDLVLTRDEPPPPPPDDAGIPGDDAGAPAADSGSPPGPDAAVPTPDAAPRVDMGTTGGGGDDGGCSAGGPTRSAPVSATLVLAALALATGFRRSWRNRSRTAR